METKEGGLSWYFMLYCDATRTGGIGVFPMREVFTRKT